VKTLIMDAIIIAVLGACASLLPSSIGGSIAAAHPSKAARARSARNAVPPTEGGDGIAISTEKLQALNNPEAKVTLSSLSGAISIKPDRIIITAGDRLEDYYLRHSAPISAMLWFGPGLLLLLGIIFLTLNQHSFALACARVTFFCEKFLLIILAATAVLAHIFFGINFLLSAPHTLWLSPVIFLLAAAALMRYIDMNYPFWNEAIMAMAMPILASIFILGWTRVPELVARFKH